ncbi:glycoside hydrolase family 15 protein [bacterium]|nr:glycoside hydrolase family 15 protein [bacterium]
MNGICKGRGISDYTTGLYKIEGYEGSFRDAEDGVLSKNPIEHGLTDSVVGFYFTLSAKGEDASEALVHFWIAAGKSIQEALDLNNYIFEKTPEHLLKTTHDFWSAWINRQNFNFYGLSDGAIRLFKESLFIIRSHVDATGAVIASGDSDMLQYGRDTYSYMWPRDGAFSIMALDKAGDSQVARKFFEFCNMVLSEEGFFMHKYRADGSLGSSWHPWVTAKGEIQLPIQEDETALVLFAIWKHYELSRDLEFVEQIYNSFIQKAAHFMMLYRDKMTGLPKQSYDLWEERLGISTFTSSAVYGALIAASRFARLLGKTESEREYSRVAEEIKQGIMKHLYNAETGSFYRMIKIEGGNIVADKTIDISSVYGVFRFGIIAPDDPILKRAFNITEEKLFCSRYSAGFARYEGDNYYRAGDDIPGNPWFVTTLWAVQYYIATAKEEADFSRVRQWFDWVVSLAPPSGVLSEQINPYTKEQISASPLTWSHSEYVLAVMAYLEKLEELGICIACAPVPAGMLGMHADHAKPMIT